MKIVCPLCKVGSSNTEWRYNTARVVVGTDDISAVGNPEVDTDPNFFYICPCCDKQVTMNEIDSEDSEEITTKSVRVTLAVDLDIEPGWSRERILEELNTYLVELVDFHNPPENVFNDIAVEGIDY
jgi:hypothetical protein